MLYNCISLIQFVQFNDKILDCKKSFQIRSVVMPTSNGIRGQFHLVVAEFRAV